jgi:omega-amidase
MRAHLVQLDLIWESPKTNHRLVEESLDSVDITPGDLVVLPELFDTGFSLNTGKNADAKDLTLRFLLELADDLGITIQGSRTVMPCSCDKARNNATIVGPKQELICEYSKVHPFTFGREPEEFQGGSDVTTYYWKSQTESLKVCPAVCYDLRFPELFRAGLSQGAELFAIGANWPEARQAHWRALAIARAIENQAFVLAVNRTGSDPHLNYIGGSIAIGPQGEILGELAKEPGVLTVAINPDSVREWRKTFPAWKDCKIHTF